MAPLVWLITGCSSGLGEGLVREALQRGDQVIATARNGVSRLSHLAEIGAATLEIDLTASQTDLNFQIEKAVNIRGRIDVLVNNAGYIEVGTVEEST
jgi:NAD(P)-dependent dehydrogenase (short-subunit alcohol dehydrogenase family)